MGVAIALEIIEKLKNTPGINGMHVMAVHWEAIVPRLVEESGVPKPAIQAWAQVEDWFEPTDSKSESPTNQPI